MSTQKGYILTPEFKKRSCCTYSSGFKVNDLPCEVRRCDEIVCLIVQCEGALVGQELVLGFHAAQREDAGKFELTHQIAIFFAQFLPLKLQTHRGDVLHSLSNQSLDLGDLLLGEDGHHRCCLDQATEHAQTAYEVTLRCQVDAFDHFVFEGLE